MYDSATEVRRYHSGRRVHALVPVFNAWLIATTEQVTITSATLSSTTVIDPQMAAEVTAGEARYNHETFEALEDVELKFDIPSTTLRASGIMRPIRLRTMDGHAIMTRFLRRRPHLVVQDGDHGFHTTQAEFVRGRDTRMRASARQDQVSVLRIPRDSEGHASVLQYANGVDRMALFPVQYRRVQHMGASVIPGDYYATLNDPHNSLFTYATERGRSMIRIESGEL